MPTVKLFLWVILAGGLAIVMMLGCSEGSTSSEGSGDGDSDGDSDGDGDGDSDGDGDGDGDGDSAGDGDGDGSMIDDHGQSFLWVANTDDSTISKINTETAVEVARYKTCPYEKCDPSRTSVNLHGDMVVTNRNPEEGGENSSVTKFAAKWADCVDANNNGQIDSSNGKDDVREWGEDECMLWNTELGIDGARATAWDGSENKDTGVGGRILIGTCHGPIAHPDLPDDISVNTNKVYILNGDTGEVETTINVTAATECFYGGAMGPDNIFWVMEGYGYPKGLLRFNLANNSYTKPLEGYSTRCGYGISVDGDGNVWMGGKGYEEPSCVARYNPDEPYVWGVNPSILPFYDASDTNALRGIAVGLEKSAGFVWAASTDGTLHKVNQVSNTLEGSWSIGIDPMVGVAIDYKGYVWAVSSGGNETYKFDPETGSVVETVPVGENPYTYSDMTGMQLLQAIEIE